MSIDVVAIHDVRADVTRETWAFEELYRTEYPRLVAVATALTGRVSDGEDMVQDTMVKAFLRWKRVQRLERPGSWCLHVLVNACRSFWRRRRTERNYLSRSGRRDEPFMSDTPPDVIVFWELVRALPSRPRMAVTLHFAGDRTMAEVAAMLDVPEGTVRSDIARARTYITAALRGE
ncbi:MAG TPA: sigma-70 family RNA polymerase sigma factor [Ilumatobacteraceae bacterium]|nr:sigma-70 family RNA polymerase sigma factor [Ilumatobacteraceae bacterium]